MRALKLCVWSVVASCVLFPVAATASNVVSAGHNGLLHTLQTDKAIYVVGELVEVCYTVQNTTSVALQVDQPNCGCPLWVAIYAEPDSLVWCRPCGCADEYCSDLLEPGEFHILEFTWDMENYWTGELTESRGMHRVNGRLHAYPDEFDYALDLDIAILDAATSAPETGASGSWSVIKSLYR